MLSYLNASTTLADTISIHVAVRPGAAVHDHVSALLGQLHVTVAGEATYTIGDGAPVRLPRVAVIGPTTAAMTVALEPGFDMAGVGLFAAGWTRAVGIPADLLADSVIDAELIWPAAAVRLLAERVAAAADHAARAAVIEAFLAARVRDSERAACGQTRAIDAWIEGANATPATLAERLNLCPRQCARVVARGHGASPKLIAMKYRALRVAAALATGQQAELLAAEDAYVDQSHLGRDFRRFIGCTPRQFAQQRAGLARAAIQGRWNAGARRPIALLS